jgi:glycerophosphoryl diester phosphodiesterase
VSVWRETARSRPLVIGHRGGRGEGFPTENTLASFEEARKQGARAIELDVRLARDGEIVVFHDVDLARLTGGDDPRVVEELEWAELRAVALAGPARMPLLVDVLEWARTTGVAVNVEIKRDVNRRRWPSYVRRVARLVRDPRVDLLISSFDPILVAGVGALAPSVPRAWLLDPKESPPFAAMAACARRPIVDALHPRRDQVTRARVERLHSQGTSVGVYTVNEIEEAKRLADWGVDWLITDQPGALLGAL